MRHVLLALALAFPPAGCESGTEAPGTDVLSDRAGGQVVFATTECVSPHPDGVQCNKKTCKEDRDSDCQEFAKGCIEYGHHYSGTAEAGTCSRVL